MICPIRSRDVIKQSLWRCQSALVCILLVFLGGISKAQMDPPSQLFPDNGFGGQLLEKGTRTMLTEVSVFVLPQKWKAVTDAEGRFHFSEVPSEPSKIIINLPGHRKLERPIDDAILRQAKDNKLQLFMERESYQYLETTVTGLREKKEAQKQLKAEEFLTMPGSGGDPIKAVQNLPGVNRSGGSAQVIIQGSEPEDTKYNISGHEVPLIFHFGGVSSILMPEAVESVDFFSAGYPAELGRAIGGHIGLNVRAPKTDRLHAIAFMDSFNAGGLVEGPIDANSSYLMTGRYSYIGTVLKAATKNNDNFNLTVAPTFYDFGVLYQNKINPKDDFRFFSVLSQDKLEFVLNKPIGNDPKLRGQFFQQTRFHRFIPEWVHAFDETSSVKVTTAYGNNDILADIGTNYFHLWSTALTNRVEYRKVFSTVWKSNVGIDSNANWYHVQLKIPATYTDGGVSNPLATGEVKETEVKGNEDLSGIYFINEIKPEATSNWTLIPQVRTDHFSPTRESLVQPRLAVRYQHDESLLFRASTGVYYQLPQPQEYDVYYGNPNLHSQKALHYLLGFEKDFREGSGRGYSWSGGVFSKDLREMVIPSGATIQREGSTVYENFSNRGKGSIKGFETQLKFKDQDNLQWTISYTWLRSRRQSPGQEELPSRFDQTHSLNVLVSYLWNDWQIGSRFRYVTGNPYTPVVGATFDADNDVYIPQRGSIYSQRNGNFMQLDLRVDRKWVYDTWILGGYVDIQNLTNAKNPEGLSYSYDYSQKENITGLPLLPSIGLKGEF